MDREIFTYFNGKRDVRVDPMALEHSWREACKGVDIEVVMNKFFGPDFLRMTPEEQDAASVPDDVMALAIDRRDEGARELIPVLCKTFGVKTLAEDQEDGMTYVEILRAYTAWMDFVASVKKNTDSNQDSPQPTGPQSPPTTTSDSSATTTIPNSPSGSVPSPLPPQSVSP